MKRKLLAWVLAAIMVLAMLPVNSLAANAPSGYTTNENGIMAYSYKTDSFDIKGYFNNSWKSTTYSDAGFVTYIKQTAVSKVSPKTLAQGGCALDGLNTAIDIEFVNAGKTLKITYTVENTGTDTKVFSLGTGADIKIGSDDSALITAFDDGTGFKMVSGRDSDKNSNGEYAQFNFFGKEYQGVTDVSDFWYGAYSSNDSGNGSHWASNASTAVFYGNDKRESRAFDSAASWHWANQSIGAGATKTYSILIGIGGSGSENAAESTKPSGAVTFDSNGGSAVAGQNVVIGKKVTKPADPTKTGYVFAGWYKDSAFATEWDFTTDTVTEDTTLYAKWTASSYAVTLNTNGGTINSGNVTSYTYGIGATLPTNVTKEGHTFEGWYDNSSFTGTAVTSISTTATGAKTYYAKWEEICKDYVIDTNVLSEVQEILLGVANVVQDGDRIKITLTSDISGRIKFERPAEKFVLDLNNKTIDPGTKNEAICVENGCTATLLITGSGTLNTGVNNVIYKNGGSTINFAVADGYDYFTLKNGTSNVLANEINTTTAGLARTFNTGTSYVLTQVVCSHPYTYSASGAVITESCICGHRATATVTAPTGTLIYDGTAKEAAVEYSAGWQGGTLAISYGANGNINAGNVTASITKASATATASYVINKADPIYTAPTAKTGLVYNGNAQELINPGTVTGGTMKYAIGGTQATTAIPTGTGAGEYRITCVIEGDANHNNAYVVLSSSPIVVNIEKLTVTVSWSNTTFVYDGTEKTVTANVTNAANADVVNLIVSGNSSTNAGSYTASITAVDNNNYALPAVTTHNWSIQQSITGLSYGLENDGTPASDFTYGDTITVTVEAQPTGTAAPGMGMLAVPAADQMALFLGSVQITEPADPVGGEYTFNIDTTQTPLGYGNITLTGQYTGTANMASATIDIPLTLEKAPSSIGTLPAGINGLVYNLGEQTLITAGEGVVGGTLMYKLDGGVYTEELPKAENAGTYTVYYKVFGDANHLDTAEESFAVTIAPKTINPVIALTAPKANEVPETTVETTEYIASVVWSPAYNTKFNYGTVYTATITIAPKANYTVTGVAADGYVLDSATVTNAADSDTVTAVYPQTELMRSSSYTVKFNTNGAGIIAAQRVQRYAKANKPTDPTKAGYLFAGWFTDKAFTMPYDFTKQVKGDITLYAKWEELIVPCNWPFTDVSKDDWFYEYVKYVFDNGLMNGIDATTFDPNGGITRAMMVTVLYRAETEPDVDISDLFDDVESGSYYEKAVAWGKENGIVKGYSETEFAPDEIIIREQVAAIMYRYANYKGVDTSVGENTNILSYEDFDEISEYAIPAIQYAAGSGFMKGNTESTWNPQVTATRAQIAAIITRILTLE